MNNLPVSYDPDGWPTATGGVGTGNLLSLSWAILENGLSLTVLIIVKTIRPEAAGRYNSSNRLTKLNLKTLKSVTCSNAIV